MVADCIQTLPNTLECIINNRYVGGAFIVVEIAGMEQRNAFAAGLQHAGGKRRKSIRLLQKPLAEHGELKIVVARQQIVHRHVCDMAVGAVDCAERLLRADTDLYLCELDLFQNR